MNREKAYQNIAWLEGQISGLVEQARNENFLSEITDDEVSRAKLLACENVYSAGDVFLMLSSVNLLNAAVKRAAYKKVLHYGLIKGKATRLLVHLIRMDFTEYGIDLYINPAEKCAYVEIFGLQFSFHNIGLNDHLGAFAESDRNRIKPWKEIRLQRVAGELFNLAEAFNAKQEINQNQPIIRSNDHRI